MTMQTLPWDHPSPTIHQSDVSVLLTPQISSALGHLKWKLTVFECVVPLELALSWPVLMLGFGIWQLITPPAAVISVGLSDRVCVCVCVWHGQGTPYVNFNSSYVFFLLYTHITEFNLFHLNINQWWRVVTCPVAQHLSILRSKYKNKGGILGY